MTHDQINTICLRALAYCDVKPCGGSPYLRDGEWIVGFKKDHEIGMQVSVKDRSVDCADDLYKATVDLASSIKNVLKMSM